MSQFNRASLSPTTGGPRRAAVYCRVSSAGQEDNSGLATQEARCRAHAAERGWSVVEVYREVHTGADLFERPSLSALREAVRRREVDAVVAYALDRLTRNQAHLGLILSEADHAGVEIELVTERLEDTPEGRLLQSVRGFVAEVERLKIAERTARGKRALTDRGLLLPGSTPPLGYRFAARTVDGKLRPKAALEEDPATAPLLRRIFREYAAGVPLRELAARLDAEGIPTARGIGSWRATTLRDMLRNTYYIGEARVWRTRGKKSKRGRYNEERPLEEQTLLPPGTVPALVDRETFAAVQDRLARNRQESARNNRAPEESLLRGGYARCGYCGSTVIAFRHGSGPMYRCGGYSRDIPGCRCNAVLIKHLDAAVWSKVEAVLTTPEIIEREAERLRHADPAGEDVAALDRRLAEIAGRRARIGRAVAALDDEEAAAPLLLELKALAAQKRQLDGDRALAEAQRAGWQAERARLADLETWCRRVASNLPSLDYRQKRDLLAALDVHVTLYQKGQETPRWVISMSPDDVVYGGSGGRIP